MAVKVVTKREFEDIIVGIFENRTPEEPVNAIITYVKPVRMRKGTHRTSTEENPTPNPYNDVKVSKGIIGKYELCNETYTERRTRIDGEPYESKGKGIIDDWIVKGVLGYNDSTDSDYLCAYPIEGGKEPDVFYLINNRKAKPEEEKVIRSYEYESDSDREMFNFRLDRIESVKIQGQLYRLYK